MKETKVRRLIEVYINDNGVWRFLGQTGNYLSVRVGVNVPSTLDGSVKIEKDTSLCSLLTSLSSSEELNNRELMLVQQHKNSVANVCTMQMSIYKIANWRDCVEFSISGKQSGKTEIGIATISSDKTATFNK